MVSASDVDWQLLGRLAQREGLLGLLWPSLSEQQVPIPAAVATALRRQAMLSEFTMAAIEREMRGVVRVLAAHDITVMLLKGSALALVAYRSFARRPMGDLDVLVPREQARRAWDLLRDRGWVPDRDDPTGVYETHQHLCPLIAPGQSGVVVEIHRALLHPGSPFVLDEQDLWDTALPVNVDGATARVPSLPYQALHLCIHFAWSHTLRVGLARTVRDVATIGESVEWDRVVALARTARAESCCYWTLTLAAELGGAAVPAEVLRALAPATPRAVRRALQRAIAADALDPRGEFTPSLRLQRLVWTAAILPGRSGHGSSRPWTATAGFEGMPGRREPGRRSYRALRPFVRAAQWSRYLRVLTGLA
jgi:Uncharacterised nucleotidyltransferase